MPEVPSKKPPMYFVTQDALHYHGEAKYIKFKLPPKLDATRIKMMFYSLATKFDVLGIYYDPEDGTTILWIKPTQVKTMQLPLIPIILSAVAGLIGGIMLMKPTQEGSGTWNPQNPPGLGISIWDLIKLGGLAFIFYMFAKGVSDLYLAFTEKKPMPSPYEVYIAPAVETGKQVVGLIKR